MKQSWTTIILYFQADSAHQVTPDAAQTEEPAKVVTARAEDDIEVADGELALFKASNGDGFRCMDKVMTVEEIVYDEEVNGQEAIFKSNITA